MTGEGFLGDIIKKAYSNYANKHWRSANQPKLESALHPPLLVRENGKINLRTGNYLGPSSDVTWSIKDVQPVNYADKVSQYHDLAYLHAQNPQQVREADEYMKKKLKQQMKKDSDIADLGSNLIGYLGIAAKNKLEDWKINDTNDFASFGGLEKFSEEDQKALSNKMAQLRNELGEGHQHRIKAYQKGKGMEFHFGKHHKHKTIQALKGCKVCMQ